MTQSWHSIATWNIEKFASKSCSAHSQRVYRIYAEWEHKRIEWNIHLIRRWKGDTEWIRLRSMFSHCVRITCAPFVIAEYLSLWFTSNYAKIITMQKYWNNLYSASAKMCFALFAAEWHIFFEFCFQHLESYWRQQKNPSQCQPFHECRHSRP